jgi:hypothetical protein
MKNLITRISPEVSDYYDIVLKYLITIISPESISGEIIIIRSFSRYYSNQILLQDKS